jgi:2-dehydropantoate 2-reductase
MTRVAILGAGAIGSVIGAFLSRAGTDVTLIARPAHVDAIGAHGLHVDGRSGFFTIQVPAAEKLLFTPDITFLTVKSQDVLGAITANLEYLRDAPIVTFQNGIRSDELVAGHLPRSQIVSAVVSISATYLAPGMVTVVFPGSLVIGHPFAEGSVPLGPLQELLSAAAPATISRNIRGVHWLKLLFNLNNAFPALTGASLHELYAQRYMRELAARVIREGLHAVDAAGLPLESLPEVSVGLFRMLGILPAPLAGALVASRARRIDGPWPLFGSTLQSLRRGRPTEIDYLNGEIVRLGQETGSPTPLNALLVRLVHEVERAHQFLTVDELRRRLDGRRAAA